MSMKWLHRGLGMPSFIEEKKEAWKKNGDENQQLNFLLLFYSESRPKKNRGCQIRQKGVLPALGQTPSSGLFEPLVARVNRDKKKMVCRKKWF